MVGLSRFSKKVAVGNYKYKSAILGINVDTIGNMEIKNKALSFLSNNATGRRDTIAKVEYLIDADTLLIIRYSSVSPVVEIKYKKVK